MASTTSPGGMAKSGHVTDLSTESSNLGVRVKEILVVDLASVWVEGNARGLPVD